MDATGDIPPWKFIYLEVSMLLPSIVTGVLFWKYGYPMIALLTILLFCYLIVPGLLLYLDKVSTHVTRLTSSFANIALEKSEQIKKGLIWFAACLAISFLAFFISLSYVRFWSFHTINFFYMANTEIIVISVLMLLLDPFLEEFFWRVFLQSGFAGGLTYSNPKEWIIWIVAIHYGLLYVFIFAVVTSKFLYAIFCAIPFVVFSRKFAFIRDQGVLTAILAHTGFNLGFVIVLNLWYWNNWEVHGWKPYEF
ncbi:unnamed protein product [Paramecium octaurelia]|uniref:CAAX prenyl protease 2/Lysostaphin resistance protein A-like domain-containing protein n=1 Tax=Paramecium octaurelia TaxID=43137 RepID=A0A8S1SP96_PAROT|nr:unnamed protein product [Paramecium octaurelia]